MTPPTSPPQITRHALERMNEHFGVADPKKAQQKLLNISRQRKWKRCGNAWIIEEGPYKLIRVGKKLVAVSYSQKELAGKRDENGEHEKQTAITAYHHGKRDED